MTISRGFVWGWDGWRGKKLRIGMSPSLLVLGSHIPIGSHFAENQGKATKIMIRGFGTALSNLGRNDLAREVLQLGSHFVCFTLAIHN